MEDAQADRETLTLCPLSIYDWTRALAQAVEDAQAGRDPAALPVPPAEAGEEAVVAAVLASAYAQMDQDRKSTALKALQACCRCSSKACFHVCWCGSCRQSARLELNSGSGRDVGTRAAKASMLAWWPASCTDR